MTAEVTERAREAVARVFAQIMASRYPGTVWEPFEPDDEGEGE